MDNYKIFDSAWDVLGIDSEKIYMDKFLIKGKFHNSVPEKIKEEFITVEYLIAFAFYHIELYNEAFNKCMRLLELAIKLKAKDLQIEIRSNNGREKNLNTLINEVCLLPDYSELKKQLDWFRKLRNMEMHPSDGNYLGAFFNHASKMKLFVNCINFLFLDDIRTIDIINAEIKIKNTLKLFNDSYYTALVDNKKYLIKKIIDVRVINIKNETALIITLIPVLTDTFNTLSKYVINPISVVVFNYSFDINLIKGISENSNPFLLASDTKKENKNIVKIYDKDIKKLEDSNIVNYEINNDSKRDLNIIDLTYLHSDY